MAFCANCGAEIKTGARFCMSCGRAVNAESMAAPAPKAVPVSQIGSKRLGLSNVIVQVLVVVIVCSLFSLVFWKPLAMPGRVIAAVTPWIDCSSQPIGSVPMFFCSFAYAFTRILGPLVITVILVVMRNRIRRRAIVLLDKVPASYRFLGAPLLATAIFGITWAWAHESTASFSGLLPQTIFPMVAGLFCYVAIRYTRLVQKNFDALLKIRNLVPRGIRFLIALAVPLLIAISMTGQLTDENKAQTEQTITLIGLVTGYVAMVPRSSASGKQVGASA